MPEPDAWPDLLVWYGRPAAPGERIQLDADESHHAARVLRVREDGPITVADGEGSWLSGRVTRVSPAALEIEISAVRPSSAEPEASLVLGFPPLRSGRTEWLLEKGTELGVTSFVPIRSARTRPTGRPGRWERVVRAAAMQCLRARPPAVAAEARLEDWLEACAAAGGARWVAVPGGRTPRRERGAQVALVGPEGAFTPEELRQLDAAGFRRAGLGARRLRSETAAIVLVAALTAPR